MPGISSNEVYFYNVYVCVYIYILTKTYSSHFISNQLFNTRDKKIETIETMKEWRYPNQVMGNPLTLYKPNRKGWILLKQPNTIMNQITKLISITSALDNFIHHNFAINFELHMLQAKRDDKLHSRYQCPNFPFIVVHDWCSLIHTLNTNYAIMITHTTPCLPLFRGKTQH